MNIYEYSKLDSSDIRKLIEQTLNSDVEYIVKHQDRDIAIIPGDEYRAMKGIDCFHQLMKLKMENFKLENCYLDSCFF